MQNNCQQSVLITGASSGIGQAIAAYLAGQNYLVFATVRKESARDALLRQNNPNLVPIYPLDLSSRAEIPAAVSAVQAELERRGLPGLSALINNAGGGEVAPIELMDVDSFERELHTRLSSAVALLQGCLPLLRQGSGRVLWIMTPAAIPTPYVTSIHACDFAVSCITRTLALELRAWNIPVVQIRCGGIDTPAGQGTPGAKEALLSRPGGALYRGRIEKWYADMAGFDQKRTPAVKVAEVVQKALSAAHPRRHYSIGHMAGLAAFLESLPQDWGDWVLSKRF
jgi:NAD(P)-dependent dehydrogenase (short-subunit alcohol dehydrogenase family)